MKKTPKFITRYLALLFLLSCIYILPSNKAKAQCNLSINCTFNANQNKCAFSSLFTAVYGVTGGTPPYVVKWSYYCNSCSFDAQTPASGVDSNVAGFAFTNDTVIFDNGGTGGYSITVTDSNGCSEVCSGVININNCFQHSVSVGTPLPAALCLCQTLNIPFTSPGHWGSGNDFIVELSNASGSFTAPGYPINITNYVYNANQEYPSAAATGTIPALIPCNLPPGNGYLIRILANDPPTTGAPTATGISTESIDSTTVHITGSSLTICNNSLVNFIATPDTADANDNSNFNWFVNGQSTASGTGDSLYNTSVLPSGSDTVVCVLTSNYACPEKPSVTSNKVIVTVGGLQTVGVHITASDSAICNGTTVTFTATGTSAGTAGSYTWYLNSNQVAQGVNDTVYTNAALIAGDKLYCVLNSNNSCAIGNPATSNTITISAAPVVTPTVSFFSNASGNPCAGTPVTFTATGVNGGTTPTFQWYSSSGPIAGATDSVYTTSTLPAGNNNIYVKMTSSVACASPATVTSSTSGVVVTPLVTPTVSVTASVNSTCPGVTVNFTANGTNGGSTPAYQWYVNGQAQGGNLNTFGTDSFNPGANTIKCKYTTNAPCATVDTALDSVIITVNPNLTAAISSIAISPAAPYCPGETLTFTPTITNGGTAPTYQWNAGGANVPGATNSTFSSSTLTNGEVVKLTMISNATCVTNPTVSNSITVTLLVPSVPLVSIAPSGSTSICINSVVNFTATPDNGGAGPTYKWLVGGVPQPGTTANFSYTFTVGTTVQAILYSNLFCVSPDSALSPVTDVVITPSVTPKVTIGVSANPVCPNTPLTFSTTETGGGGAPTYKWTTTGNVQVGTGSSYSPPTPLATGPYAITCTMTSNSACATSPTATDDTTITVTATVVPSVIISPKPPAAICPGNDVSFTSTPSGQGVNPTYQWRVKGIPIIGATNATFTTGTLAASSEVSVYMTSDAPCATPAIVGDSTLVTVTPAPTNSVTVTANPAGAICQGANVTFTAASTQTATTYNWLLNGVAAPGATNSPTYASTSLNNGDIVTCSVTTSAACVTNPTDTSNAITMTVNSLVPPTITVHAPAAPICPGQSITFTTTAPNPGTYQWYVSDVAVPGATASSFSPPPISVIQGTYCVKCVITSSALCAIPNTGADSVCITVLNNVTPAIAISPKPPAAICPGSAVSFTAIDTANGGISPTYQWRVSALPTGTSSTYTTTPLTNITNAVKTYEVSVYLTSDAVCASPATVGDSTIVTVNPALTNVVTVTAMPSGAICQGTSVTFTATPTQAGNAPAYQWNLNGNAIPNATGTTYTSLTLNNGDKITCTGTSNATCITDSTTTSNTVTMTVNPILVPGITVNAPAGPFCPNQPVTFTLDTTNAGKTPGYQWSENGVDIPGTFSCTYTPVSAGAYNVKCVLTSDATCVSPTTAADSVSITVLPNVTPTITISPKPPAAICPGSAVSFTSTDTANEGVNPVYKWRVNAILKNGAANSNYITVPLTNPSNTQPETYEVSVYITSDAACALPATVGDSTSVTVNPALTNVATVTAMPSGAICQGTNVTFTATASEGGTTPSYQWYLDGGMVGTNSATYSNSTLKNQDNISCSVTSNATCITNPVAPSNTIVMTVNPILTPSVTVTAPPAPLCPNTTITFTADTVNAGKTPTYAWSVNGTPAGGSTPTFSPSPDLSTAGPYTVKCTLTSDATCVNPTTASNSVTITILPNLTASVVVTPNDTTVCQGMPITFKTASTNPGTAPLNAWKLDGVPVPPATDSIYTVPAIAPGSHTVTGIMTSNAVCVLGSPASATVNVTVLPSVIPDISIAATNYAGDSICPDSIIDFTSTPGNGGTAPTYLWYANNMPVPGGTNANLNYSAMSPGNYWVKCLMTSNATCAVNPAISDSIDVDVVLAINTSVTITANPSGPICPNQSVVFTATPVNGGPNLHYQWFVNGSSFPHDSSTYTVSGLTQGIVDSVYCLMTSSLTCASPNPATSNTIGIMVNNPDTSSISIQASTDTICAGSPVTFSIDTTNAGSAPMYQWLLNGIPIGGQTGSTYTTTSLTSADSVSCVLTSNAMCVVNPLDTSANVGILVNPILIPSITVTPDLTTPQCAGTPITFTATPVNPGTAPTYTWFVDGTQQPASNSPTYLSSTLSNGDSVECVMISNAICPNPTTVNNSYVVTVIPYVTISIAASTTDTNVCEGKAVSFTASVSKNVGPPAPTFDWQLNGASFNPTVNDSILSVDSVTASGDVYSCIVISNAQCVTNPRDTSNSITMSVTPTPVLKVFPVDTVTCYGTVIPLTVTGADSYEWAPANPDSGLSCTSCPNPLASPSTTTTYTVTGTSNNCSSQATSDVVIGCKTIFAPTLFTPNGDGINDTYRIYGPKINNFKITIFDRWGEMVYQSDNQEATWDGTYKGKPAEEGVYVWIIEGDISGNRLSVNGVVTGNVTLLR